MVRQCSVNACSSAAALCWVARMHIRTIGKSIHPAVSSCASSRTSMPSLHAMCPMLVDQWQNIHAGRRRTTARTWSARSGLRALHCQPVQVRGSCLQNSTQAMPCHFRCCLYTSGCALHCTAGAASAKRPASSKPHGGPPAERQAVHLNELSTAQLDGEARLHVRLHGACP